MRTCLEILFLWLLFYQTNIYLQACLAQPVKALCHSNGNQIYRNWVRKYKIHIMFLSKQLIFQVEIRTNHDYSHNISAFPVRVQPRWRRRLRMRHWLRHARGNQDRRKREGIRKFCHAHIFPNIFTEKL